MEGLFSFFCLRFLVDVSVATLSRVSGAKNYDEEKKKGCDASCSLSSFRRYRVQEIMISRWGRTPTVLPKLDMRISISALIMENLLAPVLDFITCRWLAPFAFPIQLHTIKSKTIILTRARNSYRSRLFRITLTNLNGNYH